MRYAHDVATVRESEDALMRLLPEGELMQRAAHGLARTCASVLQAQRGVYGALVVLLVGAGNNGGDALFAGARLARRGAAVTAVLLAPSAHEGGLVALRRAGGRTLDASDPAADVLVAGADLVVDGIVGIGGAGGLRPRAAELVRHAVDSSATVVAVDLPSGVDADTGAVVGEAVFADVTVTFGTTKPGLVVAPGALHAGLLEVVDIGLGPHLGQPAIEILDAAEVAQAVPHPHPLDHKYSSGVVGVAAGSVRYPGAAVLTVGAAVLAKPGLVRYVGQAGSGVVNAWPSAVVSDQTPAQAGRVDAWAVGPGLGLDGVSRSSLTEVLAQPVPCVVDADGLTLLADLLLDDADVVRQRDAETVLTPHAGEFRRLAPDVDATASPLSAARTLASRTGCVVLLKGYTTVVAEPGGRVRANPTGTPWLATGGTGDVLAGLVAAYLAAGLTAFDAASCAAFVHGLAGRLVSDGAPASSRDLVDALPAAYAALH